MSSFCLPQCSGFIVCKSNIHKNFLSAMQGLHCLIHSFSSESMDFSSALLVTLMLIHKIGGLMAIQIMKVLQLITILSALDLNQIIWRNFDMLIFCCDYFDALTIHVCVASCYGHRCYDFIIGFV